MASPLRPPLPLDVDFNALRERRHAQAEAAVQNAEQFEKDFIAWGAAFFGGDLGAAFNLIAKRKGITPDADAIDSLAEVFGK